MQNHLSKQPAGPMQLTAHCHACAVPAVIAHNRGAKLPRSADACMRARECNCMMHKKRRKCPDVAQDACIFKGSASEMARA